MTKERLEILLQRFKSSRLSQAEYEELMVAIDDGTFDQYLQEDILTALRLRRTNPIWTSDREKAVWAQVVPVQINAFNEKVPVPVVVPVRWSVWYRISAAAAILIFSTGIYLWMKPRSPKPEIASTILKNDAMPGHSGAVLTLSNGQKIVLDSAGNGVLTSDASVKVIKRDGEITYQGQTREMLYNVVSTDKGRQWQLALSDGTKVWLNAASSIRYPLTFIGNERIVEITGEAYFEVVQNPKMPFKVKVNDQIIEDIGTHFNINAYHDEAAVKTTLIEGSVKVTIGSSNAIIKPGEQASVANGSAKIQVSPADVEEAIAWKNGMFSFKTADIETVMRQVARWYDVDVVYERGMPQGHYRGEVSRNVNASEMLKVLEVGGIHFKIEGKEITVIP